MVSATGRHIFGLFTEEGRYNSALLDETGSYGVGIASAVVFVPAMSAGAATYPPSQVFSLTPQSVSLSASLRKPTASPYQNFVPFSAGLVTVYVPVINPFQQNVPIATVAANTHNPTCYRPPLFTGAQQTAWVSTPTNKRFIRSEV